MTNAEAWFNKSLRPRKPEGSLGRAAQDGHLGSHTAPELCLWPLKKKNGTYQSSEAVWKSRWPAFEEDEWDLSELRSCVKVEVAVLSSPSVIVLTVSVEVKQLLKKKSGAHRSSEAV